MSSFYLNQANIDQAVLICQILGRKAMTLEQINTALTARSASTTTEAALLLAGRNGWLLIQPSSLYQVNPLMSVQKSQNRLIASGIPNNTLAWTHGVPASNVGALGIVYSKAVQQDRNGLITLYGNQVTPRTPLINDSYILAPNPIVI
jgi:hypothetical protein